MATREDYRKDIERYRPLLGGVPDSAVRAILKRLIEEARAAIDELDAETDPRDLPIRRAQMSSR
jgi:hypothetical protein